MQQGSTAAMMVESLLQRCLAMQAFLHLESHNAVTSPSATKQLASALSVLVACLPSDWQALVAEQPEKTSAADDKGTIVEGTSASSTKHGGTTPSMVGLVTWPSDLVQLALLLRRRWVLQRDLHLLVMALRDLCAVIAAGSAGASPRVNLRLSAAEEVQPPAVTVAVALAVLQLPRTLAMLEAHEERKQTAPLPVGGTRDPTSTYPDPCAATVLPVWLWRAASRAAMWQRSDSREASPASCQTAAPVTAVMAALSFARQITQHIVKWEAHVARYVSANLAATSAEAAVPPPQGSSSRDVLLDVQAELSLEHAACGDVQLLWLAAAATVITATGDASRSGSLASAEVGTRCSRVERALRTLWPTSAVGRALLPGVLLLLGSTFARHTSGPEALASDARSRELHCYTEAYSLGRQVLGSAHPVVEAAAALLPDSAVAASGERLPLASAPAPRAAVPTPALTPTSSTAHRPLMTGLGIQDTSSPLHPPLQQHTPTDTLNRLPPLPPLQASYPPRPPVLAASVRLPAPPPQSLWLQIPQAAATTPARTRFGMSKLPLYRGHTPPPSFPAAAPTPAAAGGAARPPRGPLRRSLTTTTTAAAPLPAGRSLRSFYQLQNPEDAFLLRSDVQDCTIFPGKQADTDGAQSKKSERKEKVPLTKAGLLLSAVTSKAAPAAGSPTSGSDADGNVHRRKKRDRNLLPPLGQTASPLNVNKASPSKQSNKQRVSGDQQQGAAVEGTVRDSFTDGAPLDLGSTMQHVPTNTQLEEEQQSHTSASRNADNTGVVGSPVSLGTVSTSSTGKVCSTAMSSHRDSGVGSSSNSNSSRSSSHQLKRGRYAPQPHTADATGAEKNAEEDDDEDDEEDDEDDETLPERNARYQREIINYYAEINDRRVRAALVIQMAWRSSKARAVLRARQQILYEYVYTIQKAAALAIEGLLACALGQRRRKAALRARTEADNRRREQEALQVAAAQRLTRAARQYLQRQRERRRLRRELNLAHDARLRLYVINAVKVQQWWRHVVVEKAYWRRRTIEVEEQQRLQAEVDRQAHAAATIQKHVRGIQTRRRVRQLRETREAEALALRRSRDTAATVLAIVLQEYAKRQSRLQREALEQEENKAEAAQRIAVSWHGVLERRRFDIAVDRARQLRTSATCIQRAWRHYAAGRQRRYLRQLRRTVNEDRVAHEARTYEVIRLLQCFSRSAQAQLLARRIKARQGRTFMENLFLIQAAGRGALARAEAGAMYVAEQARRRAAAAALQARRLRAICLSQTLLRAHASSVLVQHWRRTVLEERLVVRTTAAREMREEAAATVLQRAVRRRQMRKRIAAAAAEAAAALAFLGRMAHRIQQAWRVCVARRERRYRAAKAAECAHKRLEQEEVWRLIWEDQFTELETLCLLERQYIEEHQHTERVAIYNHLCDPDSVIKASDGYTWAGDAFDADANVWKWAALYNE
ncbi:hypothetical protein JKF63_07650 [Porcisia hertigi]|uniref:Uncharacterized protein n=1 Tax=Porcisia hertigi TaxID=2761500 RepID=A0A836LGP4_9TRYP|nr:hypothetical protein JKF63_07650 [Porcisia hertigi]